MARALNRLVLAIASLALAAPVAAQDADRDGVPGAADNCPLWPNPLQADSDGNGIGDGCECGDQNGDHRVDVRDLIAINQAIFDPSRRTALCDTDFDGDCDVGDILGVRHRIFGGAAHCGRNPPPGFGRSAFVSAPDEALLPAENWDPYLAREATTDTAGAPTVAERVVEEGDIYRVLPGGRILNLNSYRGLQVIDVSDVQKPRIIGRLALSGSPVELYVIGERAFVVLNRWLGYFRVTGQTQPRVHDGAVILAIDLSDPSKPVVSSRAEIEGYIHATRVTREGERASLYLATGTSGPSLEGASGRTIAYSFDLSSGSLGARASLDLGEALPHVVQATPEVLMISRLEWSDARLRSRISLVDIRDPNGAMRAGGEVVAANAVLSQFNLDFYRGVLRAVSSYSGTNTVETWNASDLQHPVPVDSESFGAGESLFATLFLGNKAFFVTFLRIDPFHAFEIDDAGGITARAEFEVSGWNDFFRSVARQTRLIGVGIDDQSTRSAAISLYDITNLSNSRPLIARTSVEATSTWSEAAFDHRAFSVLEDAVDVAGPGGARERGLVLLPFSGVRGGSYQAAVQIFTFSETTLSRRGLMEHGSPVRRSFLAAPRSAANLSDETLGLYGVADPDSPEKRGEVELAPSYSRVLLFGGHIARVRDPSDVSMTGASPQVQVEIVPRAQHPDSAAAIARFDVPAGARLQQVGDLLVALEQEWVEREPGIFGYRTEIRVHDLSDPQSPRLASRLVTDRIDSWLGPVYGACLRCATPVFAPGFPPVPGSGDSIGAVPGGLVVLDRAPGGDELEALDLRWPETPRFADTRAIDPEGWASSLLVSGSDAWISFQRAVSVEGDERRFAQHFLRRFELSNPSLPDAGAPINVPGSLIAVEGSDLYTRDTLWSSTHSGADTGIARLVLRGNLACLQAERVLEDRVVEALLLDGAGRALVAHREPSGFYPLDPLALDSSLGGGYVDPAALELSVLDDLDLRLLSNLEIDPAASLRHALVGKALFQVWGGVLVYDLADPTEPTPQAFFATQGYPSDVVVDGRRILVPAGRYGIYAFDLDESNLIHEETAEVP